jgi:hypothetical protein
MTGAMKDFLRLKRGEVIEGEQIGGSFSFIYPDRLDWDPAKVSDRTSLLLCYLSCELAGQKVKRRDFDSAWSYYNLAERNFIRYEWDANCRSNENYPKVTADALWVEAEDKLEPWNKERVRKLLFNSEKLNDKVSMEQVVQAKRIIDHHDGNVQLKASSIQWQLTVLGAISSVLLIISLFILSNFSLLVSLGNGALIVLLCTFGALGGSISGIFSFSKISLKDAAEIPSQSLSAWLTIIRPLVGAVSALVMATFVLSGLVDFGAISANQLLAVAFISGFSERLILGAADKIPN